MRPSALGVFLGAALTVLPAWGSELGVLVDQQVGSAQAFGTTQFDAARPTGYGLRGAYTVLNLQVAEVGLTATYHPECTTGLTRNGASSGNFGQNYIAVGAQVDWKFLVNVHAGLDIRREKLTTESVTGISDGSTYYTRPWLKAGIGYSIPTPAISPFVRLEVAMPTTKAGGLGSNPSADEFRKAMASDYQISLYGGIRF